MSFIYLFGMQCQKSVVWMKAPYFLYTVIILILKHEVLQKNKPPGSLASPAFWREPLTSLPLSSADPETLRTFPTGSSGEEPAMLGHGAHSPPVAWSREEETQRAQTHKQAVLSAVTPSVQLLPGYTEGVDVLQGYSRRLLSLAWGWEGLRSAEADRPATLEGSGARRADSGWGQEATLQGKKITCYLRSFTAWTPVNLVSLISFTPFPITTAPRKHLLFSKYAMPFHTLLFFTCSSFRMGYPPLNPPFSLLLSNHQDLV